MREIINEDALCVLKKNKITNHIEIEYIVIKKPFVKIIEEFCEICDNADDDFSNIIDFINATPELNQLTGQYRYCASLSGSYQAFSVDNKGVVNEIIKTKELFLLNQQTNEESFDYFTAINDYKEELKWKYKLWHNAFSINKTYRLCHEDKSILTFSHRIDGWSNPLYQLTPNFSVEIKTNFGYGRASYFYTKLKYKNIEITPFSEWIDYEFAKFSEIVRYTQSHRLQNEYWFEAMDYAKDACNLSLIDEEKFVEKYIIDECETMVNGLEEFFNKDHFSFKDINEIVYNVDKKGHVLVEFRGEKISGALDFISKILEFEKITAIKSFINRIEQCNISIQPFLVEEEKIIKVKITNLNEELTVLKPNYLRVIETNNDYNNKKTELRNEMINNGNLGIQNLDDEFYKKYSEYKEFQEEFQIVIKNYIRLTDHIQNLSNTYNNIISYNYKIKNYFAI